MKQNRIWNVIGAILMMAFVLVGLAPSGAQAQGGGQPMVAYATRSDATPALRAMPQLPPLPAVLGEMFQRPRKLLPNRDAGAAPQDADGALQTDIVTAPAAPTLGANFEGVNNVNGVLPPDTVGDIGPNHYVQMVNLAFAIYDRSGNKLYGPANGNTLWQGFGGPCETTNDGDPVVLYDHLADRWIMTQFALPNYPRGPFYECIAVSQTPSPLEGWYRYEFQISNNKLNDYPKFGVWTDGYYMSINQFSCKFIGCSWGGAGAVAFERDAMLTGGAARMVYFDLYNVDPNLGGMLPADLDGPVPPQGAPNPFAQMDDNAWGYSGDQLQIWNFHVDWNNPSSSTFSLDRTLSVEPFDSDMCAYSRNCIQQPGGTRLDSLSDRLMFRLQYRNFGTYQTMVVNHTVDANGADRAGIRWYELRDTDSGWSVQQQGTYSPDSANRWVGSIAMNGAGDIGLGYSVASSSISPSIRFTGRLASDPLNQMTVAEGTIINGSGYQQHTSGRWGDYAMLAVDPVDDCTFWFTTEYYNSVSNAGWQTRVGSFKLADCGPVDHSPTVTITSPTNGATVSGSATVAATAADDNGVTQVAFLVDGVSIGVDTVAPYEVSWDTTSVSDGLYTVSAVATDTIGQTGSTSISVTVQNAPLVPVHVGALTGSSNTIGMRGGKWNAVVTITVHNANHSPANNVTVTGSWSGGASGSCTTISNGTCTITLSNISKNSTSVTFTVNNLGGSGYTYSPADNDTTTVITIPK